MLRTPSDDSLNSHSSVARWASVEEATSLQLRRFSRAAPSEDDKSTPSPSSRQAEDDGEDRSGVAQSLLHLDAQTSLMKRMRSISKDRDTSIAEDVSIPSLQMLNSDFDALAKQFAQVSAPPLTVMRLSSASGRRKAPPSLAPLGSPRSLVITRGVTGAGRGDFEVVDRLNSTAEIVTPRREELPPRSVTPPAEISKPLGGRLRSLSPLSPQQQQLHGRRQLSQPRNLRTPIRSNRSASAQRRMSPQQSPPVAAMPPQEIPLATVEEPSATERPATPSFARARDGRIKVVVRKRPLGPSEPGSDCVTVEPPAMLRLAITKQRIDLSEYTETSDFAFDASFDQTVHNDELYRTCTGELLDVALSGGSASCFAYGQTGSGKTYTMMGGDSERGLYLLAASDLFSRAGPSHRFSVAFYEIYCNSLYDLLNGRSPVVLREDGNRRVNICGLSWHSVASAEELWGIVSNGMDQRRTGSTSCNERSSRSHAIMSIQLKDDEAPEFCGTINFVDLAGSERGADTANNDRQTRLEGAEINKSLLALKECIRALDEKKRHVPFRGSRLTEVLRDSFTGNSKTVMIANVSPSSVNYEHTANTLRYAFRVKGLSIASVAPSKARNAPRPYQSPARARPSNAPTSGSGRAWAANDDSRDAPRSPRRNPSARRRRAPRSISNAGSYHPREDVTALMEDEMDGRSAVEVTGWLPQLRSTGEGATNRGLRQLDRREQYSDQVTPRSTSTSQPISDLLAIEERVKRRVMQQLQQDLGREIQQVLDERDALIATLRRENAELKAAVAKLQGPAGSVSSQEESGNTTGHSAHSDTHVSEENPYMYFFETETDCL